MGVWQGDNIDRTEAAKVKDQGRSLLYWYDTDDNDDNAATALYGVMPATLGDLYLRDVKVTRHGVGLYSGMGTYAEADDEKQQPNTNEEEKGFEVVGKGQKITQTLTAPAGYGPSGGYAPLVGNAIGVNGDKIDGCEIIVPEFTLTRTRYYPNASMTNAFFKTIGDLVGKTNNATFMGFPAGSLLFNRCAGSVRGRGDWKVDYAWAYEPNKSSFSIGDFTITSGKKGWEYLWTMYRPKKEVVSGLTFAQPVAIYVSKVYEDGDMSLLGLS